MEKVSDFGSRLRSLMEERGLSYEALGDQLGMNPQTLNRYTLGQREPKAGVAAVIALHMGVDLLWLQGYDVPKSSVIPPEAASRAARGHNLPILNTIRGGSPTPGGWEILGYAPADVPDPERHFFLRISGGGMEGGGIRDGDLLLIRQQDTAESGQIVACEIRGEGTVLRRFSRQGDLAILQSWDPDREPQVVPVRDFLRGSARIVGVAVRLIREL